MGNKKEIRPAWVIMQANLKKGFDDMGFTPSDLVRGLLNDFHNPNTRPADRLRLAEVISKWEAWNAPEKVIVTKDVVIGLDKHDI